MKKISYLIGKAIIYIAEGIFYTLKAWLHIGVFLIAFFALLFAVWGLISPLFPDFGAEALPDFKYGVIAAGILAIEWLAIKLLKIQSLKFTFDLVISFGYYNVCLGLLGVLVSLVITGDISFTSALAFVPILALLTLCPLGIKWLKRR